MHNGTVSHRIGSGSQWRGHAEVLGGFNPSNLCSRTRVEFAFKTDEFFDDISPSNDTIVFNSRVLFAHHYSLSCNKIAQWLTAINI